MMQTVGLEGKPEEKGGKMYRKKYKTEKTTRIKSR